MIATAGDEDSFLALLAEIEHLGDDRSAVIARYQDWIERNTSASPALYGGYFNLGVELSAAEDKPGAMEAYREALAIRPGFYPAAINLGTLMEAAGQPDTALAVWRQGLQTAEARTSLLAYRDRLAEARRIAEERAATVLHVGRGHLPPAFQSTGWREIRRDADATDMHDVADGSVDAVYAAQTVERLRAHEVTPALREMRRVLKPGGFAFVRTPDLREVARHVAEGRLEEPLYVSPAGPIAPLDILYGHRPSLAQDPAFNGPRTGFTDTTLAGAMIRAGFVAVMVRREPLAFQLTAIAFGDEPDEQRLAMLGSQMLSGGEPAVLYRSAA